MRVIADLHTHTLKCGHAYSTLREMAEGARLNGIKIMATTDHGPNMPGAANLDYFRHLIRLPEEIEGVRILKGVEANIVGLDGSLDVPDEILAQLDIVLVGFHPLCGYEGESVEDHTRAMIGAIKNPLVDLVVHPGNPMFPIDVKQVVAAAMENDVILEINNSSFRGSRKGSQENCYAIAKHCLKEGITVSVDSDAHISFDVGRLDYAIRLVKQVGMKPEQVLNTSVERVMEFVNRKRQVKKGFFNNK
ncbi:phosphatase [Anoxybacter fermentans]|uniref:Phosphatase n=1 Tax=Anoxybacter fermentans TaxID=1323375 RepID=A0A3Q9HNU8_9FIRM|nr:phosphatase [Anoxybacter fermentans]AZR72255.1 phosphatase [Anoxybacter fermentans]